mmetsp:Transcript_11935/g.21626  ORF Transcript_11935/g.21626 Transcript_11935/m.21626 type:complete len:97 (+) Transcript_11935:837-1127(+)
MFKNDSRHWIAFTDVESRGMQEPIGSGRVDLKSGGLHLAESIVNATLSRSFVEKRTHLRLELFRLFLRELSTAEWNEYATFQSSYRYSIALYSSPM